MFSGGMSWRRARFVSLLPYYNSYPNAKSHSVAFFPASTGRARFFANPSDPRDCEGSTLLERGPVLLDGFKRELLLFSDGFLFSYANLTRFVRNEVWGHFEGSGVRLREEALDRFLGQYDADPDTGEMTPEGFGRMMRELLRARREEEPPSDEHVMEQKVKTMKGELTIVKTKLTKMEGKMNAQEDSVQLRENDIADQKLEARQRALDDWKRGAASRLREEKILVNEVSFFCFHPDPLEHHAHFRYVLRFCIPKQKPQQTLLLLLPSPSRMRSESLIVVFALRGL